MSQVSRKSIFLSKDLKKDSIINPTDLSFMRPGDGILANQFKNICGMKLNTDLSKNHKLTWDDLYK